MPINVLMPALSPTMTEGKLAKWLVSEGDEVTSGKVIAEIETDKATMEVEAVDEGVVAKILIDAGTDGVAVNTPIAVLAEEGEDASKIDVDAVVSSAANGNDEKSSDESSDESKATEDSVTAPAKPQAEAVMDQLQQAVGQHVQLQLEGFYTANDSRDNGSGARFEIFVVF